MCGSLEPGWEVGGVWWRRWRSQGFREVILGMHEGSEVGCSVISSGEIKHCIALQPGEYVEHSSIANREDEMDR